jgi:MFS family permease
VLLSFASFGVGFVARPIGGVIFGHIGDKRGRKFALVSCLLGMALCTTAMGLLPSYATIGPAAGVLLVSLRLVQGIFFGGEAGGALMLLGEVAPPQRRGLYGAIAIAGAPGGIIIANGVFFIVTAMAGDNAFTSWAWRIPFLSSVILIAISIYANSRLNESPSFLAAPRQEVSHSLTVDSRETKDSSPVLKAIQAHWKEILLGAGTYAALNVSFYVIATFAVQHATGPDVGMSKHTVLGVLLIASFVMLIWSIAAGHLSDLYGRHLMLLIGAGGFTIWSFVMWPLINAGSFWLLLIAFVVGLGGFAGILSGVVGIIPDGALPDIGPLLWGIALRAGRLRPGRSLRPAHRSSALWRLRQHAASRDIGRRLVPRHRHLGGRLESH